MIWLLYVVSMGLIWLIGYREGIKRTTRRAFEEGSRITVKLLLSRCAFKTPTCMLELAKERQPTVDSEK